MSGHAESKVSLRKLGGVKGQSAAATRTNENNKKRNSGSNKASPNSQNKAAKEADEETPSSLDNIDTKPDPQSYDDVEETAEWQSHDDEEAVAAVDDVEAAPEQQSHDEEIPKESDSSADGVAKSSGKESYKHVKSSKGAKNKRSSGSRKAQHHKISKEKSNKMARKSSSDERAQHTKITRAAGSPVAAGVDEKSSEQDAIEKTATTSTSEQSDTTSEVQVGRNKQGKKNPLIQETRKLSFIPISGEVTSSRANS